MTKILSKRYNKKYNLRNISNVIYNKEKLKEDTERRDEIKLLEEDTELTEERKKESIIHLNTYYNLKSFEEMCMYMYLFVSDRVCYQPSYFVTMDSNLDENGDNIQYYLQEFNKYKYFTRCSQPSRNENNWEQRAAVSGYMRKNTANAVSDMLKDDSRIIISYKKDENMTDYVSSSINVTKYNNEECTWFGRIDSKGYKKNDLGNQYRKKIVLIEFIDKEYGNNDEYVFKKVLNALKQLNKPLNLSDYDSLKNY